MQIAKHSNLLKFGKSIFTPRNLYRRAARFAEKGAREFNVDNINKGYDVKSYASQFMDLKPDRIKSRFNNRKHYKEKAIKNFYKFRGKKAPGMYANDWKVQLGILLLEQFK